MVKIDNDKRRERIVQGIARSGYKSTGKKPNLKKHKRILELNEKGLSKIDIATLAGVCEATVYNVLKAHGVGAD